MATQWDFMRTWWGSLSQLIIVAKSVRGSQRADFNQLGLFNTQYLVDDEDAWIEVRDALELVMLQRSVDEDAFMAMARAVLRVTDYEPSTWGDYNPDGVIACGLEIWLEVEGHEVWLLSSLLEPVPLTDRSKRFQNARSQILLLADEATRRELAETRWTIPVIIGVAFPSEATSVEAVERIVQLKEAMDAVLAHADNDDEEQRRAALRAFPFRAVTVDLDLSHFEISDGFSKALDQVKKTEGLRLRHVNYFPAHELRRQTLGAIMHNLMDAGPSDGDAAVEGELVIAFHSKAMEAIEFSHVLSTLLHTRQFEFVSIESILDSANAEERQLMWLWIAHTFFSSRANHTVTSLLLCMNEVRAIDVATVRSYMDAKNPVALLCLPSWRFASSTDPTMQPRKQVALAEGVNVLLSPPSTHPTESMPSPVGGWFDVIQEDDNFADVVVPAYAQCRVRREDVTEWRELTDMGPEAARNSHPIKSLTLNLRDQERSASNVRALLELVGRPLESLGVDCARQQPGVFLDAVWVACPNLKVVNIKSMHLPSLDYFIDAYEAGRCKVESIDISACSVGDMSSRMRFFQALEGPEPRTKLASTLREFSFTEAREVGPDRLSERELVNIAHKLRTNLMLRYLGLGIPDIFPGIALDNLEAAFDPLRDEFVQSVPLSIHQRRAFISVVKSANDPEQALIIPAAGQISQLHSDVPSAILAFAAQPVQRSVTLKHG